MSKHNSPTCFAVVDKAATSRTMRDVAQYLPTSYRVIGRTVNNTPLIAGEDVAGWTLDEYVIPRLRSGMLPCREVSIEDLDLVRQERPHDH